MHLVEPKYVAKLVLGDVHPQLGCVCIHHFRIALHRNIALRHTANGVADTVGCRRSDF